MDAEKTGALIRQLRIGKDMTQRELAQVLMVSDKAVSKWERGMGCPDISVMGELCRVLSVDMESLLAGRIHSRKERGENMRRIQFYICPICGNVITATAGMQAVCCSRPLEALKAQSADQTHTPVIEPVDGEQYLTFEHPMDKGHYLRFVALVRYDRVLLVRLYPEQGAEVRLPYIPRCTMYICCSEDGLHEIKT